LQTQVIPSKYAGQIVADDAAIKVGIALRVSYGRFKN
jgi:hypothetical protein